MSLNKSALDNMIAQNQPVVLEDCIIPITISITKATVPAWNEARLANDLEELVVDDKGNFVNVVDVDFRQSTAFVKQFELGSIHPSMMSNISSGVSYDGAIKTAVKESFKSSNPTDEELSEIATAALMSKGERRPKSKISPELLAEIFEAKPEAKEEDGSLNADIAKLIGKVYAAYSAYPAVQRASVFNTLLGSEVYASTWKPTQTEEFNQSVADQMEAIRAAEAVL